MARTRASGMAGWKFDDRRAQIVWKLGCPSSCRTRGELGALLNGASPRSGRDRRARRRDGLDVQDARASPRCRPRSASSTR